MMRTLLTIFIYNSSVNCISHVVHYILSTYYILITGSLNVPGCLFVCLFFGHAMQFVGSYPSSLTRYQTRAPAVKAPSPNHWTTRELPINVAVFERTLHGTTLSGLNYMSHSLGRRETHSIFLSSDFL